MSAPVQEEQRDETRPANYSQSYPLPGYGPPSAGPPNYGPHVPNNNYQTTYAPPTYYSSQQAYTQPPQGNSDQNDVSVYPSAPGTVVVGQPQMYGQIVSNKIFCSSAFRNI